MKSLFPNASLRQLRWPSVQPANVQRRQKHFWVIESLLGSIDHVQNKGSVNVHELVDGFIRCRKALSFPTQTKWLFEGANLKRSFSYLKARNRSLSPVTVKQPSNGCSYFSHRHRWLFTALCWTRADNYKKHQLPLKTPKLALIFFFCMKPHLFLRRPL